jgi:hypothetical protein
MSTAESPTRGLAFPLVGQRVKEKSRVVGVENTYRSLLGEPCAHQYFYKKVLRTFTRLCNVVQRCTTSKSQKVESSAS